MKHLKAGFLALVIATAFGFTGCATLWKTMGVATTADQEARQSKIDQEMATLRQTVDELSAKASEIERISQSIDEVKAEAAKVTDLAQKLEQLASRANDFDKIASQLPALQAELADLQGKIDAMPRETLAQLASILEAAVKSAGDVPKP